MARTILAALAAFSLAACAGRGRPEASPAAAEAASMAAETASVAAATRFPPRGVDHLRMEVDLEIEVFGIGKDSLTLAGSVVVDRGDGEGPQGSRMRGELLAARLAGKSPVFGNVVALVSPLDVSTCDYRWEGPQRYHGGFDIHGWFLLLQHDLIVVTRKPVRVEGPARAIPPVGQSAKGTNLPVDLHDFRKPGAPPIGGLTKAEGRILKLVRS